jgi:hypothetical protein
MILDAENTGTKKKPLLFGVFLMAGDSHCHQALVIVQVSLASIQVGAGRNCAGRMAPPSPMFNRTGGRPGVRDPGTGEPGSTEGAAIAGIFGLAARLGNCGAALDEKVSFNKKTPAEAGVFLIKTLNPDVGKYAYHPTPGTKLSCSCPSG